MKNNVRNNTTELVFILDRSGSMAGLEGDTIGGFNAMVKKQKKEEGKCYVTTVLFDDKTKILHDRLPLEQVKPMTDRDYTVGGCTALLDALGSTIRHIADIHRYARKEDVPAHTVFVITTDGMENASRSFSSREVKQLIAHEKEKYGWEFLFVAANIDALDTAESYGISRDRAVNYRADAKGTRVLYDAVCCAIQQVRSDKTLTEDWCAPIRQDYEDRS